MPLVVKEAIAVEGKYDTIRLRSVVDTVIVETGGFAIFKDKKKLSLLRQLAAARGLIVLTDSDAAGFVIRDYLTGALPKGQILQAYVPELPGKEKRKKTPSAEGLLGVEGIDGDRIVEALYRAGATVDGTKRETATPFLTKARLYADGLSGGPDSARLREAFLQMADWPRHLSANRLVEAANAVLTEDAYEKIVAEIKKLQK